MALIMSRGSFSPSGTVTRTGGMCGCQAWRHSISACGALWLTTADVALAECASEKSCGRPNMARTLADAAGGPSGKCTLASASACGRVVRRGRRELGASGGGGGVPSGVADPEALDVELGVAAQAQTGVQEAPDTQEGCSHTGIHAGVRGPAGQGRLGVSERLLVRLRWDLWLLWERGLACHSVAQAVSAGVREG